MYPEDARAKVGAFGLQTMRLVATGLKAALSID